MAISYLALGSNLGDRTKNIEEALRLLRINNITVIKCATIIESEPVGGIDQGKFLNTVVKIETSFTPHNLLNICKLIEKVMGRRKSVVNGPRKIDLDILVYELNEISTPQLTIPHPRMTERSFVMEPLKEIEPELALALLKQRHAEVNLLPV